MLVLVTYDIGNARALRRTARLLNTYGTRVQKSVFECHVTATQFRHLVRKLHEERSKAPTDTAYSIRCYRLGAFQASRLTLVGTGERTEDVSYFLV